MFSNIIEVLYSSDFRCLLRNLWALVGFRGGVAWLSASLYVGWGGMGNFSSEKSHLLGLVRRLPQLWIHRGFPGLERELGEEQ